MCLRELTPSTKPCKTGYKVVISNNGNLYGEWYAPSKYRPINEWLDEVNYRNPHRNYINFAIDKRYKTGWHVFNTIQGAKHWQGEGQTIVKVKVKEPIVVGKQDDYLCTVAKYIKIVEVLNG